MKYLEEKFSGFSIIYFHNLQECVKCRINSKSIDDFDWAIPQMISKKQRHLSSEKLSKNPKFMHPLPAIPTPLKAVKVIKKKKPKPSNSGSFKPLPWCSKNNCSEEAKAPSKSKLKKKTSVEKNTSTKKGSHKLGKKSNGSKIPGKGTLKRKRWYLEKLNQENENYEDDLFEDDDFAHFQNLLEDDSDSSEKYEELKTPVFPFSLSPRDTTPSPMYRDCYSPTQLSISRKEAEKYQYRKKKWRKLNSSEKEEAPRINFDRRTEDVLARLIEVSEILNIHRNSLREEESDNEEDAYFSDLNIPSKN